MKWPFGLYGPGMHDWILTEMELGYRVACGLDSERVWGAWGEYLLLTMRPEDFGPPVDVNEPF